jgi:hypothetical protein
MQASSPPLTLSIIRSSLFGVALRDFASIDAKISKTIAQTVQGGLAGAVSPRLQPTAAPSDTLHAGAQRAEAETPNGGGAEAGCCARSSGPTEPRSTRVVATILITMLRQVPVRRCAHCWRLH